jgi:hypothetical protein
MDPIIEYGELTDQLTRAFEFRYKDGRAGRFRMAGILFARPSSTLAKLEILPQIADWHFRSGNHIDFFFAGYSTYPLPPVSGFITVDVPGGAQWLYSPEQFDKFRQQMEHRTSWRYSGACDLLLCNAFYDEATSRADLDFRTAIVCQLDAMKKDNAIAGIEQFFEAIFRFAELSANEDPTWGFSDQLGVALGSSALKRMAMSLLPRKLDDSCRQIAHLAVTDIAK